MKGYCVIRPGEDASERKLRETAYCERLNDLARKNYHPRVVNMTREAIRRELAVWLVDYISSMHDAAAHGRTFENFITETLASNRHLTRTDICFHVDAVHDTGLFPEEWKQRAS